MSDIPAASVGLVDPVISTESDTGVAETDTSAQMNRNNAEVCREINSNNSYFRDSVVVKVNSDEASGNEVNTEEVRNDDRVLEGTNFPDMSLSAFKEATLKLLDQVTPDDSTTSGAVDVEINENTIDKSSTERSALNPTMVEEADQVTVDIAASDVANSGSECCDQTSHVANAQVTDNVQIAASFSDAAQIDKLESDTSIDLTKSESPNVVMINSESENNSQTSMEISNNTTVDPTLDAAHCKFTAVRLDPVNSPLDTEKSFVAETLDDEPSPKKQKLVPESPANNVTEDFCSSHDVVIVTETPNTYIDEVAKRQSVFTFKGSPRQLTGAWKSFEDPCQKNYLRGCKWAPDGTCILTNSNDNSMKIFNLPEELYYDGGENKIIPEMNYAVEMKEADTVYDFCWYPMMSSSQPDTACLAVTSKDTPVHLYDAFTGEIRCSYRAYNHVDEVVAAHCIEFNPDGSKLYCGFNKIIRVFDVTRPGRDFVNRPTFAKEGQRGIIACIDHSRVEQGLYAAGSYSRSIALYSEPDGSMVCMFEGQHGGVTQVKFSPDGTKLYSGGRKDNEILCWDLRNPGQILFTLQRSVTTNQRIYFDITSDGVYVVSGSTDGIVRVWDTTASPIHPSVHLDPVIEPTMTFQAHKETVNSVSLHPTLPVVATGSGERHFKSFSDNDDDSRDKIEDLSNIDNSLRLWWT